MLTILKFCINAVWINFIYLFQVKIYICSFKRPIVIKRIIYYNFLNVQWMKFKINF